MGTFADLDKPKAGGTFARLDAQAAPKKDKIFQPIEDYAADVGAAVKGAGDAAKAFYRDASTIRPIPANPVEFVKQGVGDQLSMLKAIAAAGNVPLSLVSSIPDALIAAPVGRAIARTAAAMGAPVTEGPKLSFEGGRPHLLPARQMSAQEGEDSMRGAINGAMMAAMPARRLPLEAQVMGPPRPMPVRDAASRLPKADAQAMAYVDRLASATPELDKLRAAPDIITGAEAIGQPGKAGLGALARRSGATGEALNAEVSTRQLGRPERILNAFADASGVAPEAAAGDIQALVKRGRAEAAPLYAEAYDSGPMVNSKLEDLARRPSVRDAIKRAFKIAGEEGVNPEQLGLTHLDNIADWENAVPPSSTVAAEAEKVASRPGPAKATQGKSLAKFIADGGGIKGADHEISVMDGELWHHGKAYQRKLIGNGDSLDGHAMRAWEAGYFPEFTERPTPRDLLDALDAEFRGKPRFAREVDPRAAERIARHDQASELAYRGGLAEDVPTPEQYTGRPEPKSEPVSTTVPTARTWDYVKRGLDDVLETYRDKTTGKLVLDNEGRAVLGTLKALRSELIDANPAYGKALATSGDYLSADQAFTSAGKDLFNSLLTEKQFADKLAGMSASDLSAYRGGIANRVYDLAQTGKLDPKILKTPRVQAKLRAALGPEKADALLGLTAQEGDMLAFERRYAPGANSISQEMAAAMAEQDGIGRGAQVAGDFAGGMVRGHGPIGSAMGAVSRQLQQAVDALGPTRGMSVAARDKAGETLMMSPGELAKALEAYRASRGALALPNAPRVRQLAIPVSGASTSALPRKPK